MTAKATVDTNRPYRFVVYDDWGFASYGACTRGTGTVSNTSTLPTPSEYTGTWRYEIRQFATGDNGCNGFYSDADRTFTVKRANVITFTAPAARTYGDGPVVLTATAAQPVVLTRAAGSTGCTLTGTTVTFTGAGPCTITATSPGNPTHVTAVPVTRTIAVAPKQLTGAYTAKDRAYDGTTDAEIDTRTLDGVVGDDAVALDGGTATFDDAHVGTGKAVTGTGFALAGDDAPNYTLAASTLTTTATITAKALDGAFTVADKTYDGTDAATISAPVLTCVVGDDVVTLEPGTATFDGTDVGDDRVVTGTGFTLAGDDAGDYALGTLATTTADITAKELTGAFTADDKTYDDTTAATIDERTLTGVVGTEDVTLDGGTAAFDDATAGTGKTVTGTGFALAGADAGNYTLAPVGPTTADILAKEVTGSFTAADKVFDGTDAATITGRTLQGALPGDDVALSGGTARFADAQAGAGKAVTGTGFVLDGADKGNYALTTVAPATATITPAPVQAPQVPAPQPVQAAPPVQTTVASRSAASTATKLTLTGLKASATCVTTAGLKSLKLSYKLSKAAKVTFTIAKRNPSMARKTCGKLKTVRSDGRYDDVTTATTAAVARVAATKKSIAGRNTITLKALLGKRTLTPGTYRVLAYATDADGTKTVLKKVVFRVVG